ncbi:MFS transporter [Mycolicibacterium neoaurum]|uniref:MFS transporter n=2 Tax=Mycobacteriaceae TaxID=1762 RepID=V5XDP1_MYCNE|nr:MFS transporter [Mycolicibacterium neoaurum VKM Ac-1815D]KJQ51160.1 MFS transporter [Mycolicibacterium neoaurum]
MFTSGTTPRRPSRASQEDFSMKIVRAAPHNDPARQRVATAGVFVSFGIVLGTWAAYIPVVKNVIGATSSTMGMILLVVGVGALIGMQFSGRAVDRYGSGCVAAVGGAAMALALVPPLVLSTPQTVAAAALFLGIAVGISEVGMNASAVAVERDYGRPIMASFHGMFSIGTVVGALSGGVAIASGMNMHVTAVAIAVLTLLLSSAAAPTLLRSTPRGGVIAESTPDSTNGPKRYRRWQLAALSTLSFLLLLVEGSMTDWSSLHTQQHLGASPGYGALTLACFVTAMTIGRFSTDRVASRIGPVSVLRWGCLSSVAGLLIVTQASSLPITFMGWILVGIGLSGGFPQVLTAAGNVPGTSARALSHVVGIGYLAIVAGPATMGWLADLCSLNGAFALPIAAMTICALAAKAVTGSESSPRLPAPAVKA